MRDILENKYFEIYSLISIFLDDVTLIWIVLETNQKEAFDVNTIFRLAPQLLCIRAVIETQAFLLISCSELHHDQLQTLW